MSVCADKLAVRQYVKQQIGEEYLVPLMGQFSSIEEVDFTSLDKGFVIKDSRGCGNSEVFICSDVSNLNIEDATKVISEWDILPPGRKHPGREWVYEHSEQSKLLIEEYIEPEDLRYGLLDYKFLCFNGVAKYLYVIGDRVTGHDAKLAIYKIDGFELADAYRMDERRFDVVLPRPSNFSKMVELAEKLAAPFPHARVDLYDLGPSRGVKFGELTFFDGSGYMTFEPDRFDYELGSLFVLPERTSL